MLRVEDLGVRMEKAGKKKRKFYWKRAFIRANLFNIFLTLHSLQLTPFDPYVLLPLIHPTTLILRRMSPSSRLHGLTCRCVHGACILCAWRIHSVRIAYAFCAHSVCILCAWRMHSVCMACVFCVHGVCVVYEWSAHDVCMVCTRCACCMYVVFAVCTQHLYMVCVCGVHGVCSMASVC